jgi:uncharacterized protein (TIGR00251 family)
MAVEFLGPHPRGTLVFTWVVPNASRDEVVGPHDDRLKVRIAAPPEGGRANRKVAHLIASTCGARRGVVLDGVTGRRKTVLVEGVGLAEAEQALARFVAD